MKKNEPVKNIMTKDVLSVQLGEAPSKVRALLEEAPFHHLPVLDGARLVGMISSADLLRASLGAWGADARSMDAVLDSQLSIPKLMHANPTSIRPEATVRDAAEALAHGAFHSLPVIDETEHLVGMVTSTDLIRYLLDQY